MRISDWSSDVCSSDRVGVRKARRIALGDHAPVLDQQHRAGARIGGEQRCDHALRLRAATRRERGEQGKREQAFDPHRASLVSAPMRSEEHTSELQSLMRLSYAVFCLKTTNN